MARIEVPMPQLGESIAEGTVSVWLKKVGERVARDEPILEISTDKVDAEIPSPTAGVLVEVSVQEGETVEVGTVVAYIDTEAAEGAVAAPVAAGGSDSAVAAEGPKDGAPATAQPAAPAARGGNGNGVAAPSADGVESEEERLRRRSTPLVRRIAEEHDIDITAIQGTGRAGRVTKQDILAFIDNGGARSAPSRAQKSKKTGGTGTFSWDEFYSHVEHPEVDVQPGDRVEPMSRMTSLIAEHMVISKRISAHVHSYFEVDYSRIDQVRAENRKAWADQGVKVTYTAFIAQAVARALREHPRINAAISGEDVVYRGAVNLGIAVALDWGLIVPVVHNADDLSLVGLARSITDLATRARNKKLDPREVQGGTFTITNPGVFGTVIGFPIVNQPQVAIMGVGAVEKRPVVITDEFGNDAIVARKRGFISLGYDHRLVNGADADQFLARVKELMETAGG